MSARTIAVYGQDRQRMKGNAHAHGRNGRKHERGEIEEEKEKERKREEKRDGQKKREAKLLGKLEKRESHRSAELLVVCLGDILRYFLCILPLIARERLKAIQNSCFSKLSW